MRKLFVLAIAALMTVPAFAGGLSPQSADITVTGTVVEYISIAPGANIALGSINPDTVVNSTSTFKASTNVAATAAVSAVAPALPTGLSAAVTSGGTLAAGATAQDVVVTVSGSVPYTVAPAAISSVVTVTVTKS